MAMNMDDIFKKFGGIGDKFSRSFRGLICEKKDGKWELSKGNVSYWIAFGAMLKIWWNRGMQFEMPDLTNLENAEELAGTLAGMQEAATQISAASDVPQSMLYVWGILLGYAAVKTTKGGLARVASAWKGTKLEEKPVASH